MNRLWALAGVVLLCIGTAGVRLPAAPASQPATLASDAELDAAIGKLAVPETRLAVRKLLLATGGMHLYNDGGSVIFSQYTDPASERRAKRAAEVLRTCTDLDTISAALDSNDSELQFFGVWFAQAPKNEPEKTQWQKVWPKIQNLAVESNPNLRSMAVERLQVIRGYEDFLAERARVETDMTVVMRIVRFHDYGPDYDAAMNQAALRVLADKGPETRKWALSFIGGNSGMAEMWHVKFDTAVADRVLELSHSESAVERAFAAGALQPLISVKHDAVCDALLRLINDSDRDVRLGAVFSLADLHDDPAVHKAFERLMADPSPDVVLRAILADGTSSHRGELEKLVHCGVPDVENVARYQLSLLDKK